MRCIYPRFRRRSSMSPQGALRLCRSEVLFVFVFLWITMAASNKELSAVMGAHATPTTVAPSPPATVPPPATMDLLCQPPILQLTSRSFIPAGCFTSTVLDSAEMLICRTIQVCINPMILQVVPSPPSPHQTVNTSSLPPQTATTTAAPSPPGSAATTVTQLLDRFSLGDFYLTRYLLNFLVEGRDMPSYAQNEGSSGIPFVSPFGTASQLPWEDTTTKLSDDGACLQLQLPPSYTLQVSPLSRAERCADRPERQGCSFIQIDLRSGAVFAQGLTNVQQSLLDPRTARGNDDVDCRSYRGAAAIPVPVFASDLVVRVPVYYSEAHEHLDALGPLSVVNTALGALSVVVANAAPSTALEAQMLVLIADNWCSPQEVQDTMAVSIWTVHTLFALVFWWNTDVTLETLVGAPLACFVVVVALHGLVTVVRMIWASRRGRQHLAKPQSNSRGHEEGEDEGRSSSSSSSRRVLQWLLDACILSLFPSVSWNVAQLLVAGLASGSLQQALGTASPSLFTVLDSPASSADAAGRSFLFIVGFVSLAALVAGPVWIAKRVVFYEATEERLTHPAVMVFPVMLGNMMPAAILGPPSFLNPMQSPLGFTLKKRRVWCTLQPTVIIVMAIIMSPASVSLTGCIVQSLCGAFVCAAYAVILVKVTPYRVAMQNYVCAAQMVLATLLMLLLMVRATNVLQRVAPPDQAIATLLVVLHALGIARGVISLLTWWLERWLVMPFVWGPLSTSTDQRLEDVAQGESKDGIVSLNHMEEQGGDSPDSLTLSFSFSSRSKQQQQQQHDEMEASANNKNFIEDDGGGLAWLDHAEDGEQGNRHQHQTGRSFRRRTKIVSRETPPPPLLLDSAEAYEPAPQGRNRDCLPPPPPLRISPVMDLQLQNRVSSVMEAAERELRAEALRRFVQQSAERERQMRAPVNMMLFEE